MKKLMVGSALICLVISCCSCGRYYYTPNGVNVPMLTHAGQVHWDCGIGNDGDASIYDLQFAFSPLEHLGILAGYSSYSYKPENPYSTYDVDLKAHLFELGGGYYHNIDKEGLFVFDIYSGAGAGALNSDVYMKAFRWFMQPGIGVRTSIVEFSFNWRLCNLRYYDLNDNFNGINYLQSQNLADASGQSINNKSYLFSEPAFTLRIGYKGIKWENQLVFAKALSNVPWQYNDGLLRTGLSFTINGFKKDPTSGKNTGGGSPK